MAGEDRFELSTFADWQTAAKTEAAEARAAKAIEAVCEFLGNDAWHSRAAIVEQMKGMGISEGSTDGTLKELLKQDRIVKRNGEGRGGSIQYQLKNAHQLSMVA